MKTAKSPSREPLMTVDEVCLYLGFKTADGAPDRRRFYDWKRRHRPRCLMLGRSLRFDREDILACITVVDAAPRSLHLVAAKKTVSR